MKKDLHPTYFEDATATCGCGAKFAIGSTVEKIQVEICSNCHPFYTGQEKIIDTAGKVEKFKARKAKAKELPSRKKSEKRAARATKKTTKKTNTEKASPKKTIKKPSASRRTKKTA